MQPTPPPSQPVARNEHTATALQALAEAGERPLAEHPEIFGRVHAELQQALAGIESA